jgi:hypothetical protein
MAAAPGVNPVPPGTAPFGRRLYHLPLGRLLPPFADGPVARKVRAPVTSLDADTTGDRYDVAFDDWCRQLASEAFRALALDHDGTVPRRRVALTTTDLQTWVVASNDKGRRRRGREFLRD